METLKICLYICILVFVLDGTSSTEANTNLRRYAKRKADKSPFATDEELAEVKDMVLQLQTMVLASQNNTKRFEAAFEFDYDGTQQLYTATVDPYMRLVLFFSFAYYKVPENGTYVYYLGTDNPDSAPLTVSAPGEVKRFTSQPGGPSGVVGLIRLNEGDELGFIEQSPSGYFYMSGFVFKL